MEIVHALETALEALVAKARSVPGLSAELSASGREFYVSGAPRADDEHASRRHLEWFLFERFSAALDGVPVERLFADEPDPDELSAALKGSLCGIFEVTGVEPAEGLWLRDLLGGGEYPLGEPGAAEVVSVGDVLTGRIFPAGESAFCASPAASWVRASGLADALRKDLQHLRTARRGSLRISQVEVERMFHAGGAGASDGTGPAEARRAAVELLERAGWPDEQVDEALDYLIATPFDPEHLTPGAGDPLAELLTRLAFETEVDLERARHVLLDAWRFAGAAQDTDNHSPSADLGSFASSASPSPAGAASIVEHANFRSPNTQPAGAERVGDGGPGENRADDRADDAREALASFDRGRAEGQELDALFDQLERDLGLERESARDADEVPDFPGVVGAVVEEYLWEAENDGHPVDPHEQHWLRRFAESLAPLGVFENLAARDVLAFVTVAAFEAPDPPDALGARRLLAALAAFCRWAETEHELGLWGGFRESYDRLRDALPRVAAANSKLLAGSTGANGELQVARVEAVNGDQIEAISRRGSNVRVATTTAVAQNIEPGDWIRIEQTQAGATLRTIYPPDASELLANG